MSDGISGWAAWGNLAEEQLAGEAEALLDLYGQRYEMLSGYLKSIVGEIEVEDYVPD